LFKRFAERAAWILRRTLLAACAAALSACGASAPRQASVEPPAVVVPDDTQAEAVPEKASAPKSNADTSRRRERSRKADTVAAAEPASPDEPVPEAVLASYERALDSMRAGNWLEAELELESLTAEHGNYAGPYVNLAIVYMHDDRRDDARGALDRALAIDPTHAAANNELGILLREEGKFDEAERAYRRALDSDPAYGLAHYNLGVLLDLYLRRTAEALEEYEIYQSSLSVPDETVGRWIIDLRRRVGIGPDAARVAQEDRP
jgi:tetratricopeptide (TPR) repeat protein